MNERTEPCPTCDRHKRLWESFCAECYYSLPRQIRRRMERALMKLSQPRGPTRARAEKDFNQARAEALACLERKHGSPPG